MSYARAHRTAAWVVRTCLAALLVCSLAPLYFSAAVAGGGVSFAEDDGLIRIGNSHYEVGIDRATGGILYIRDIQAGADVSIGNAGGLLWWAFFSSGDWTQSTYYSNAFRYEWDSNADQLTLLYPASAENSLDVEVILSFSLEDWFKIEAQVSNEGRSSVQTFGLPYQLLTPRAQVRNALIPLMPGVILDRRSSRMGSLTQLSTRLHSQTSCTSTLRAGDWRYAGGTRRLCSRLSSALKNTNGEALQADPRLQHLDEFPTT